MNFIIRLVLLFFLSNNLFSQTDEKRLALVIGNANYDKGELKNPVNDANLIAETLDSLDFDVILDTNIANRDNFIKTISEFGNKRPDYDVAFVYYAGHGVQVGSENFLLPTKVNFETENDVMDFGVSVQKIMRYLSGMTNQVNILVLDACRDNPFERNWNATRSLKGNGLAKIPPPTGSLVAFSTDVGMTAADGEGENSIYCKSLSENLLKEHIEIEQIFKNVRTDVLRLSNNKQSPVESSKLTGGQFYLLLSSFEKEFSSIDSLMEIGDDIHLSEAMGLASKILEKDPSNTKSLLKNGDIYIKLEDHNKALEVFNKAIKLSPNDDECFYYRGWMYLYETFEYQKALTDFNKTIELSPKEPEYYYRRAKCHEALEQYDNALEDYTTAIDLDKDNSEWYENRAYFYMLMEDFQNALKDLDKAIDLAPSDPYFFNNRADFYSDQGRYDDALKDYAKAIKISTDNYETVRAINNRAIIYAKQGKHELAIAEFTKAIELEPDDPLWYNNRGRRYKAIEQYENALEDFTTAIDLDKDNSEWYEYRADCYILMEDFTSALKDLDKAIDLAPSDPYVFNNRADFYSDQGRYDDALKDYAKAIKISTDNYETVRAINNRAIIYAKQEKHELAIKEFTKAIELEPDEPLWYNNRGSRYEAIEQYDNALEDFTTAIDLDKDNPERYEYRADCYILMEDFTSALKDLDKAIDLAPSDLLYYNNRAEFNIDQQQYDEALKDYNYIIRLFPNDPESFNSRANLYVIMEEYDKANKDFNKAIKIDPDYTNTYFLRAKMYAKTGEKDKARSDYLTSIALDDKDPEGYYYLALFYLNQNKYLQAIAYFDKAIARVGGVMNYYITADNGVDIREVSDIYIHKAEIYKSKGAIELMCEQFNKVCETTDCNSEKYKYVQEILSNECE